MRETVEICVDGCSVAVPRGITVAAALVSLGHVSFRTSVSGQPRGPLCAMGVCFECCVTIGGAPHQRACMTLCRPGMEVVTGG